MKAVAIQNPDTVNEIIEQVLITGDLARLTPAQRVSYYHATCQSLNLNPLTRPFEYITLKGKLTLYATKEASAQLRVHHGISITSIETQLLDGEIFAVTVTARNRDGREDTDIGAIALAGIRGQERADMLMKAITKAKRRVTLSLAGLGMLDETEVSDIRDARRTVVSATGEIIEGEVVEQAPAAAKNAAPVQPTTKPKDPRERVKDAPPDEFFDIVCDALSVDEGTVKARMKELGYTCIPGKPDERARIFTRLSVVLNDGSDGLFD